MVLIVTANYKGGAAKTTTTVSLGAISAESGRSVTVVDLDPQESTADWLNLVNARQELPFDWTGFLSAPNDPDALRGLRQIDSDVVLVDTPPTLSQAEMRVAVDMADFVIVPCPVASLDVKSTVKMLRTMLVPTNTRYKVLWTRRHFATKSEHIRYRDAFTASGFTQFSASVRDYAIYREAMEDEKLITHFGPKHENALSDYQAVALELFTDLSKPADVDLREQARQAV